MDSTTEDMVVPCIEEWERDLDGPIINDLFIGVSEEPPLEKWPLRVAFVGPKGENNGEYAALHGTSTHSGASFLAQGYAFATSGTSATEPTWLEHNFDLNLMQQSSSSSFSSSESQATNYSAAFPHSTSAPVFTTIAGSIESTQDFLPILNEFAAEPFAYAQSVGGASTSDHFQQLQISGDFDGAFDGAQMTPDVTSQAFSPNASAPASVDSADSWSGSVSDEYTSSLSQDEIFEEIQRECAEIERNSISPQNNAPGPSRVRSQRTKRTARTEQKSESAQRSSRSSSVVSSASNTHGFVDRKKELNRIAATKYREKKRLEKNSLSSTLKQLEGRNADLKGELNSLSTEISYLKNLIKDIEARTRQ